MQDMSTISGCSRLGYFNLFFSKLGLPVS